jgi:hypothetical protein
MLPCVVMAWWTSALRMPFVPGLPLDAGVRWVVYVQQRFPAQRAEPVLGTQSTLPGLGQLRRFVFASPIGPVAGQGRVVG